MDYVIILILVVVKCCNPIVKPYEFPIIDTGGSIIYNPDGKSLFPEYDFCRIKNEIIKEYQLILDKLKCGILPELEPILLKISLIYINNG